MRTVITLATSVLCLLGCATRKSERRNSKLR
jgi:hypothetical protein